MGCQDQRNFVLLIYQQLFYTCCFNTNKISKTKTRFWSHSTAVTADSLVQNQEALKYFLPVGLKYFFRNAGNIFPAWLATIHTGLDWRARKCCCQNHVAWISYHPQYMEANIIAFREKICSMTYLFSTSQLIKFRHGRFCAYRWRHRGAEANIFLDFASFYWHCLFSSWMLPFFSEIVMICNECLLE